MKFICNKPIIISDEVKQKIEATTGKKPLEIAYYNGNLINIKGTNMDYINPAKVVIKLDNFDLVLLYYNEYYYEDDAFFIYNLKHKCTYNKLREIIKNA